MGPEASHGVGRLRDLARALRQFLYGMTTFEMVRDLERERTYLEGSLAVLTAGGLLGAPLPAHYYGLRLLPHLLPPLERERRRLWRERDLIDSAGDVCC